ncbi:conditional loss-of-growth 1 [Anaeramoeba ignava]|uniref:Conditional loss-of-growth 1 n=1 Tax=Anaeramoeba ignava TaxID=1746090 RepID=A0A9Q0M0R3_ANAIG|nr:conditional loss-of-growth 1 [Anaeramoeba ignava]
MNTTTQKIINNLIIRITPEKGNPTSQSISRLETYLKNEKNRDFIYRKLIERSKLNKKGITLKVFELIQKFISHYQPSNEVINQISDFCLKISQNPKNNLLIEKAQNVTSILDNITHKNIPKKQELNFTTNFLPFKFDSFNAFEKKQVPSLIFAPYFSGQFRLESINDNKSKKKSMSLKSKKVIQAKLGDSIQTKLTEIQKFKANQLNEQKQKMKMFQKRKYKMFVYKNYVEQDLLILPEEDYKMILDCVVNSRNQEARIIASRLYIKIVMDCFKIHDFESVLNSFIVFLELLNSKIQENKKFAFDLLLNLAIHSNIYSEACKVPFKNNPELKSNLENSNKRNSQEVKNTNMNNVENIIKNLFHLLNQMILILATKNEKNKTIWTYALKSFLFFTFSQGKCDPDKIKIVHPQVLLSLYNHSFNQSDSIQRVLIQIIMNKIYTKYIFDHPLFDRYFGVNFLFDTLRDSRSFEIRENMFFVLFDILASDLSSEFKLLDQNLISLFYQLLIHLHFPHVLPQLLKYSSEDTNRYLIEFIVAQKKNPQIGKIIESIPSKIIELFFKRVNYYIIKYGKYELEFQNFTGNFSQFERILETLLNSSDLDNRNNGQKWLSDLIIKDKYIFKLNIQKVEKKGMKKIKKKSPYLNLFFELSTSSNQNTRYSYLVISEQLLQALKGSMVSKKHSDTWKPGSRIASFLNLLLIQIVHNYETNTRNILKMLDLIFLILGFDLPSVPTFPIENNEPDNIYLRFLNGKITIPNDLLEPISIQILKHIFQNLPDTKNLIHAKSSCLFLISQKCIQNPKNLEVVGGEPFFKVLSVGNNSLIAYQSSKFLVEYFKLKHADKYNKILIKISKKKEKNPKNIKNAYFLFLEIEKILSNLKRSKK